VRWRPGETITWREVWRGTPWSTFDVRVVADEKDLLALYLAEGTQFRFPPDGWPWPGGHPWDRGDRRWIGHGPLILHRPGDAYTVWVFWRGADRAFAGWYINLQEPLRRTAHGVDTCDQELDIWIEPDGSWKFKDDELLDEWLVKGRFDAGEVARIREEGAHIGAALDRGERWWDERWSAWRPE
jgi:Protein of unknown function (DUF402)